MKEKYNAHVSRNEMETFTYGDCPRCHCSVIWARIKATQKNHSFDPKPSGGSEINPLYTRHWCATDDAQ